MAPFSTVSSMPAAWAASCKAASSIATGSGLTSRLRMSPSPFLPPAVRVIFKPRRLHLTGVPSSRLVFIGWM